MPATLAEIDRVWKNTRGKGGEAPVGKLNRMFYDERVERMYVPVMFEARIFAVAASVAIALALLGLLGLAASVAGQRTKQIGIRKALGANTGDVMRLLLWQFIRPVVWANLIVWPLMAWKMQRGLDAMVDRIDLPLWLFPATMLVTVLIALATVAAHTLRVARAKPIAALRHE
jgi:putative ABC transport system permease protein